MKSWLIKVLNGPNAGAQILVSKEISAGTSSDRDLILNDPHIAPLHCLIKKGEVDEFEIIPKEGTVYINGVKIEGKIGKLLLGDVLTLGSTHLTGGPREQLWPPVTIPDIQEIGGVAETEKKEDEEEKKKEHKKHPILSSASLRIIILVAICFFLGNFLLKIVRRRNLMVQRSEFRPSAVEKEDTVSDKTEKMMAEAVVNDLQKKLPKSYIKTFQRNDKYIIYIYVKNQLQYDEARKVMNAENIRIPTSIINIDDIDDSARAMMKALNFSVDVRVDGRGKATWYGYLPDNKSLDLIKNQIGKDIPAITDDEYHIILGESVVKTARDILLKNEFTNISITPEVNNVTLTGTISIVDEERWKKTQKELEREFLGGVKFVNMVNVSAASVKARGFFSAPIVSVSISSSPYAVLQNGERIFIGAKVNGGYIVDSITPEGISLKNSEGKRLVPLNSQ